MQEEESNQQFLRTYYVVHIYVYRIYLLDLVLATHQLLLHAMQYSIQQYYNNTCTRTIFQLAQRFFYLSRVVLAYIVVVFIADSRTQHACVYIITCNVYVLCASCMLLFLRPAMRRIRSNLHASLSIYIAVNTCVSMLINSLDSSIAVVYICT